METHIQEDSSAVPQVQPQNSANQNNNSKDSYQQPPMHLTNGIPPQSNSSHDVDEELRKFLQTQQASIKVIGVGGGGNNTVKRIQEVGVKGTETIAVNTDAQDLLYTTASKKILIGKEITKGLGAGSQPVMGEQAARESDSEIRDSIKHSDMVFITCGLGGGTGTGASPIVAEIAKKQGALTVGIVTMPFSMEGQVRYENALIGLERLERAVDTLIVIPNDKLLNMVPNMPLHTAFKVADEILTNSVKGIAELVTKTGLVNLDFADIKTVMGDGGVALIGVGESDGEHRATDAVEKAINNPLLDAEIAGASGALINVCGGENLTLDEARQVIEMVSTKLADDARIIWGAQISRDLDNLMKVMLIITGVKSNQIFGHTAKEKEKQNQVRNELGIEFLG